MTKLHRLWHALFGHRNIKVDLTGQHWSAACDCGYQLHVREFLMGQIGAPDAE